MKNIPALALLSLALAACSQGTVAPSASTFPVAGGVGTASQFPTDQAANDAFALAQLEALSTQSLTPQVHLNALPIPTSADSVRAYFKSTFPGSVTCTLDFGDGSAAVNITTPTTGRVDTRDHAYAAFGTYTLTVTCKDASGTVVGTQSVTLKAGPQLNTVLNFNTPVLSGDSYSYDPTASEQGFTFTSGCSGGIGRFSTSYGGSYFYWGPSQGLLSYPNCSMTLTQDTGKTFALKSFETHQINHATGDFTVTGHRADGTTFTAQTHQVANSVSTLTLDSSWTNLKSVDFGPSAGGQSIIDDVSLIPLP